MPAPPPHTASLDLSAEEIRILLLGLEALAAVPFAQEAYFRLIDRLEKLRPAAPAAGCACADGACRHDDGPGPHVAVRVVRPCTGVGCRHTPDCSMRPPGPGIR